MSYKHLFEPYTLRGVTLKNRLISAPCERNYANTDGSVTQRYIDYVEERAKGGVGLINVESIYVDPVGRGHIRQLGIHNDRMIPGLEADDRCGARARRQDRGPSLRGRPGGVVVYHRPAADRPFERALQDPGGRGHAEGIDPGGDSGADRDVRRGRPPGRRGGI